MTQPPRVLMIEDDPAIRRGVTDALAAHGYRVLQTASADEGLQWALRAEVDLLLLDLVLPDGDGLRTLACLKGRRPALGVIILTARGGEHDRVRGLRLGADDYVVKPFSVLELLARVDAVLRRAPTRPNALDTAEASLGAEIDLARRVVTRPGEEPVVLSPREAALLQYLASNGGRLVTREELLLHVWRIDPRGAATRTVDMHVARLREKLSEASAARLRTVRGRGYLWEVDPP